MIDRDQMFEPVLVACPSFASTWEESRYDWRSNAGARLHYLALGDLAEHLVKKLLSGATAEFDAVFQVVERWHIEGDPYVREAATVGLLEGIQNVASHNGIDPKAFQPWLRPETKKSWATL